MIDVRRDGELVTEVRPRLNQYETQAFAIQTPAVHTTWRGDLYVTLEDIGPDGITVDLDSSPLQWFVWVGGLLTAGGGGLALRARTARIRDGEPARV